MTASEDWTVTLVEGIAEYLAGLGAGVWSPNGVYDSTDTGILYRAVPQSPDRIITLAPYPTGRDDPELIEVSVGLQVRTRGTTDPRDVDRIADRVYDGLHGATALTLAGDLQVMQIYRQSYTSMGQDQTGRWERSDNYYIDAMRPSLHRPD